jgi:hypothetical protein
LPRVCHHGDAIKLRGCHRRWRSATLSTHVLATHVLDQRDGYSACPPSVPVSCRLGSCLHDADCIVEFGGGFGSMCRLIGALGFRGRYVIFDLPPVLALQRYYLGLHGIEADDSGRADVWLCPALDLVMDRLSKGKTGSGVADVNLGTERDGNDGAATSRAIFPPRRCQAGSVGLSAKLREE